MGAVTRAWRKEAVPKPANFEDLADAYARRDAPAFAREYAAYCAQLRAEGFPPPTLIGWLDEETGEVS
jgi:hypothetical protein